MSAYPTLATRDDSVRQPRSGLQIDQADDGTIRSRTLFSAIVYEFTIYHQGLSSADKESILTHYAANVSAPFSYTWPDGSVAHTVVYTEAPLVTWAPGGWTVEVHLMGSVT
jgi:hypothetical protein